MRLLPRHLQRTWGSVRLEALSIVRDRYDRLLRIIEGHRRILTVVVNRDPDRAERAMLTHVENVTNRLFG